uniref:NADH-ubiquinone oxidoreductase chain 4L n=1 Tax=Sminthurides bifidus TaxID=2584528 RepID=A0A6H0EYC0_9HEXA|nr:NADH dehydrogenase subunit 4L [Sminthurides bifidus]
MVYMLMLGILTGCFILCSKHKHFLLTLLSIEFLVLFFFFFIYIFFTLSFKYMSLIYITFSACEGALGLSLLVSSSRVYGSDYISSFNLS